MLLARGGGTGAGCRGLELGPRLPQQGVIWTQGWLRPGSKAPSFPPQFIREQRLKVVE